MKSDRDVIEGMAKAMSTPRPLHCTGVFLQRSLSLFSDGVIWVLLLQ